MHAGRQPIGDRAKSQSTATATHPVDALIDDLDPKELASILSRLTGTPLTDITSIDDLPAYARRLAAVAFPGAYSSPMPGPNSGRAASEPSNNGFPGDIAFSSSVDFDNLPVESNTVFAENTSKIYAVFSTAGAEHRGVFVKWQRLEDSELLMSQRLLFAEGTLSYQYLLK